MKSPLDIDKTAERYNLDEELKARLMRFDDFVWQDCSIESLEQLVAFEREFQSLDRGFDFLYDNEMGEFGAVDMNCGPMILLSRGRFQQLAGGDEPDEVAQAFMAAGLTDLETVVVRTFIADLSEMYRFDAYYYGVPPFVRSVCDVLNRALGKMPVYNETVVRACNEYDRADFKVGDIFRPGFCLTTSADLTWENPDENRYRIRPLAEGSKAWAIYKVYDKGEFQVNFLQDAAFRVTAINDWGNGKKEIVFEEIMEKMPENKIVYHISQKKYQPGDIISIRDFDGDSYYHQSLPPDYKAVNEFLSEGRPTDMPARKLCIYAFDDMAYCVYFRKNELHDGKELHLYKCLMKEASGHPMILVGKIEKAEGSKREELRKEYWHPINNWKLLEYLTEEIRILEEIPITDQLKSSIVKSHSDYMQDYDTANKLLEK